MDAIAKRKARQRMQRATDQQFWDEMNQIHSAAYFKAVQHYQEAAAIVLPPRYQKQLDAKAIEIRETWDGIREITMDKTEASERMKR
jgi:hypothetical protein